MAEKRELVVEDDCVMMNQVRAYVDESWSAVYLGVYPR